MIQIKQLTLYHLSMRLKKPFKSSLETFQDRKFIIVEAADQEGVTGWGSIRFSSPWYTEETTETCYHMLKDF